MNGIQAASISCLLMTAGLPAVAAVMPVQEGELLYNGIRLPSEWPPEDRPPSYEPMAVPYLVSRPEVIPINVGRQLFVDDFLIAETDLKRMHHKATYWLENPVLAPDRPWEEKLQSGGSPAPTAMPFSDGVFFGPQDGLLKMWYMAGYTEATAYATSQDGIHWEKPVLDVVEGTNIVDTTERDSNTVWLDLTEKDPAKRYKMILYAHDANRRLALSFSPDGIHWTLAPTVGKPLGDRTTFFYNPFCEVWVYDLRDCDAATAFIGTGPCARRSSPCPRIAATGTGPTCSPWAGAVLSSGTGSIST